MKIKIYVLVLLFLVLAKPVLVHDSTVLSVEYQNSLLSADIESATIKEIFEELKKQLGLTYEIEKEILEQKVSISFKEKELTQAIKDILNTIGNPSYMISYKNVGAIGQSPKYAVSGITIRKRGATETIAQTGKRELQAGEMEIGTEDGIFNGKPDIKYKIRAKDVNINDLLDRLASVSGEKIVAVEIDRKISIEATNWTIATMIDDLLLNLRPKIYKAGPHFADVDRKGNVIEEGYYEVTCLSDEEIQKRREKAIMANAEGEKLMKQGKYLAALDAFDKAVDPDYIDPTINAGKIYLLNRHYSQAIHHFNCVLNIDSNNPDALLGLIEVYEKDSQMDKALESMEKYVSLGKDEKKVKELKKKIESLKDKVTERYYFLVKEGDKYLGKQDVNNAKEQYEEAIKILPKVVLAYQKLAEIYENGKDFIKAEEMYKKAIEHDTLNFELYLRFATMDMQLGKNKEAIELMNKAIEICPVQDTVLKIKEMIKAIEEGKLEEGKKGDK